MSKPFKGAILSGQFTENSLNQLKSDNFHVLYIPFDKFVQAFSIHGLDVYFDEESKETDVKKKYAAVVKRSNQRLLDEVRKEILKSCETEINQFVSELSQSYNRKIKSICVLPLHGTRTEVLDVEKAIDFIASYENIPENNLLEYIEVIVTYNNGTLMQCQFKEKYEAIDFLNKIK